jgi:hypothetical protein
LIAQLPGLFLTFLGEASTLRLIEDFRLRGDAGPEPVRTTEDALPTAAEGPATYAGLEDLLLEIDRLRNVSERIETLADGHSGVRPLVDLQMHARLRHGLNILLFEGYCTSTLDPPSPFRASSPPTPSP